MTKIKICDLPKDSFLNKYKNQNAYTDCYFVDVLKTVSQEDYVDAFYTTFLFKLERSLLSLILRKSSTDADAQQLANGQSQTFSVWDVEDRSPNQILLSDKFGKTRSWLMSKTIEKGIDKTTRLYFGSAVIPKQSNKTGQISFGITFHLLSGFHKLYSRLLLASAASKINAGRA